MIKLESLKKSSHFQTVLKHRVINNDLFSIYRTKNFIKKKDSVKKLHISFIMRKKIGNAVKRNRIKRKLKSIVQKLLKINSAINSNYTYIIFGKAKIYGEHSGDLFEKMKKSFKEMKG
jgi:ribonuclease P protein component